LGHKTAITYLLTVVGCALGAGLLLDLIGTQTPIAVMTHGHEMLPDWFKIICAALLIGILAYGTIKAGRKKHCNG
jgi:hypothetical protein